MKEAKFYERIGDNKIRCNLCPWHCIIEEGRRGICGTRENKNGKLYALNYGKITALAIDPIEKKPLFHWYPGSPILSISTFGCNLQCPWCQNWHISRASLEEAIYEERSPEEIVSLTKRYNVPFIAYTYNEPFIWYEYIYDVASLARKEGIKNVFVTNGFIEKEPLEDLISYIDAANVDIKAFKKDTYLKIIKGKLEPILENVVYMYSKGVHVETTYLIVPGINDSYEEIREFARWQVENLGPDSPIHFSRFFPHYKMTHVPPTDVEVLIKARKIAMEEGVRYVYIGNVPGHEGENTYCPSCGRLLVRRIGFEILDWNLTEDMRCKFCGEKIAIVGKRWVRNFRFLSF